MRHSTRLILVLAGLVILVVVLGMLQWFPRDREPGYRFLRQFGSTGARAGQFQGPIGIALGDHEVYVSDSGNHRIQVFHPSGRFLRQFGEQGPAPGQLDRPMHITFRNRRVYVTEYGNDRVQVFDATGETRYILGGPGDGPGQFDAPAGVDVDSTGKVYVADFYHHRVVILSATGRPLGHIGHSGRKGWRAAYFNYPTDVAVHPSGRIYVADAYNDRIQVFTPAGRFVKKWGGPFALNIPGPFHGWFRTATGIGVGSDRCIYSADFFNHRIQKFSPDGTYLSSFGGFGRQPGQFDRPTDVAVDEQGRLFIVDFGNDRIQVWEPLEAANRSARNCMR